MKKYRTSFILIVSLICLLVQGCGGGGGTSDAGNNQDITPLAVTDPRLVKDIDPGWPSSDVSDLTPFKEKVYFFAGRETVAGSRELWVSDGTIEGTTEVTNEPDENYTFEQVWKMVATTDALFFTSGMASPSLWVSDGTKDGTHRFLSYEENGLIINPESLIPAGDRLYFTASTNQLWVTDGTLAGTILVKQIATGNGDVARIGLEAVANEMVYFTANEGTFGNELWVTDGTADGTKLVKDISVTGESNPHNFSVAGNLVYFYADDGIHGSEPWRSDGTDTGTWMIDDICEGSCSSFSGKFVEYEGQIYFEASQAGDWGQIYVSSGMGLDSHKVTDSNLTLLNSRLASLTPCSGILPIVGVDIAHGVELWQTDGTEVGTYLTKDINPGPSDSQPMNYSLFSRAVCFQNKLYFGANTPDADGGDLIGLNVSDGTDEGTYPINGISPPSDFCNWHISPLPDEFTLVGNNQLFFTAENCEQGRELWVMEAVPVN